MLRNGFGGWRTTRRADESVGSIERVLYKSERVSHGGVRRMIAASDLTPVSYCPWRIVSVTTGMNPPADGPSAPDELVNYWYYSFTRRVLGYEVLNTPAEPLRHCLIRDIELVRELLCRDLSRNRIVSGFDRVCQGHALRRGQPEPRPSGRFGWIV